MDTIDADTFQYHWSSLDLVGGIQWKLDYMWSHMQESNQQDAQKNPTLPER